MEPCWCIRSIYALTLLKLRDAHAENVWVSYMGIANASIVPQDVIAVASAHMQRKVLLHLLKLSCAFMTVAGVQSTNGVVWAKSSASKYT